MELSRGSAGEEIKEGSSLVVECPPSLPSFDYFFCFQPAEFGTNSIQFSRGASLDPTSTSFASTNNSTNRESSGAVFEGRRGGEIGREIREREREEEVEGEVKILASDPLSLHLLSNSLNRRGGTRLIAVRIIFTIRVTERNKLELKKKREIGDNSTLPDSWEENQENLLGT